MIQILADKRIGALVVAHADGAVAGIISERDIMRALARHGGSAFDAPVSALIAKALARLSSAERQGISIDIDPLNMA